MFFNFNLKKIFNSNYLLIFLIFIFALFPYNCLTFNCFECFNKSKLLCNKFTNCSGSACILYENITNRTSIAFCLLVTAERENLNLMAEEGCWYDIISNGIQCLCQKDFCNSPRNNWNFDKNKSPIEGLKMLKRNPFVDYEYLEEEKLIINEKKQLSSSSSSENINSLLSSLDASDSSNNSDERGDLMPIPFNDYINWVENKYSNNNNNITNNNNNKLNNNLNNQSTNLENSSLTINYFQFNSLIYLIICWLQIIYYLFR